MIEKMLELVESGKIKLYQLDKYIWEHEFGENPSKWRDATKMADYVRLRFLEKKTKKRYEEIEKCWIDTSNEKALTTGIELKIGAAKVPLGFAGPITVHGEYAKGDFFVPMATNEAALIGGANRGIKAINASGGIHTTVKRTGMARAPVLEAESMNAATKICREIESGGRLFSKLKKAAEKESKVSKLTGIRTFQIGNKIWLRFVFDTGDSMGMNSATRYAANAVKVLVDDYGLKLISLSGNLCTDKKSAHINVADGRGKTVHTEVVIKADTMKKIFDVDPESVVKLHWVKNYQGSALAGTISGFNANVANALAAMFVATGQDIAQLVESSTAFTYAEVTDSGDLRFGAKFPSIEIATIGGGCGFGTAKECLEMLGCFGPGKRPGNNAKKLAEIMAAVATAQDLNLLCAQAHDYELADSHIKLARGK